MQPVIYGDILFLINLLINYILLWMTAVISRIKFSYLRIFIGAAVGGLYSVFMFFPSLQIYYTITAKMLFSLLLVALTFNIEKPKKFFNTLIIFYAVSFSFAGAVFFLVYFTNVGTNLDLIISNGIVYFNLPWKMLLVSCIGAFFLVNLVFRLSKNRYKGENTCWVIIRFDKESAEFEALIDTGNFLYDPISNMPVIVVEYIAIRTLLPKKIKDIYEHKKENDLNKITQSISETKWIKRFRLIPYSSLGNSNGMMLGFKPDEVEVFSNNERKKLSNIIIGICNTKLSVSDSYNALLHPEVII